MNKLVTHYVDKDGRLIQVELPVSDAVSVSERRCKLCYRPATHFVNSATKFALCPDCAFPGKNDKKKVHHESEF